MAGWNVARTHRVPLCWIYPPVMSARSARSLGVAQCANLSGLRAKTGGCLACGRANASDPNVKISATDIRRSRATAARNQVGAVRNRWATFSEGEDELAERHYGCVGCDLWSS